MRPVRMRTMIALRFFCVVSLSLVLVACASRKVEPYPRPVPQSALSAAPAGPFAEMENTIRSRHGDEVSGFDLLDSNEDGLRWRLALIDSATQSIDMQYYLWYGDAAGRILVKRLLDAADRGVRVRMLVDDLNTLLSDAGTIKIRDQVVAAIDAHPNLEIRLFNPWKDRTLAGRIGESLVEAARVNQRMHNKAMIVDNRAAILGGRNIGDDYMGMHAEFNFHDLDVLGVGPVARQSSAVFDLFWNSDWVMPASALRLSTTKADRDEAWKRLVQQLELSASLEQFPLAPQSWAAEIAALMPRLHFGTSRVETDRPVDGSIRQEMLDEIFALMQGAQRELLIINAYLIPGERSIKLLHELQQRGVTMKILTNSLASHDVPAVNSHYKQWRRKILEAGVELYEIRHDAAIKPLVADTPPTKGGFMGLHSKAMVIDGQHVYIGSMNFDPRSAFINTEMGVIVDSDDLAEALAALIERDMLPANSWRVQLSDDRTLRWTDDRETVTSQPARNLWQRVEDVIFMLFPKELY